MSTAYDGGYSYDFNAALTAAEKNSERLNAEKSKAMATKRLDIELSITKETEKTS